MLLLKSVLPYLALLLLNLTSNNVSFVSSQIEDTTVETFDVEDCEHMAMMGECDENPDMMDEECGVDICKTWKEEMGGLGDIDSFYDMSARDINGKLVDFSEFQGKVVVIVNVASYCGYTEQHYRELVQLHEDLAGKAVEILAFPCNQFGQQEPDAPSKIAQFAASKGVKFRMMEKIDVNGKDSHMLYKWMKHLTGPFQITWNFSTYFLIDPEGDIDEFTGITPMELKDEILMLLDEEEL